MDAEAAAERGIPAWRNARHTSCVQVGGASSAALSRAQSTDVQAEQHSAAESPDAASQASVNSSAAVPSIEAAG